MCIEFTNNEVCIKFKHNRNIKSVFKEVKLVMNNFFINERMVWIEIEGPFYILGVKILSKSGESLGKVHDVLRQDDNVNRGHLCILTKFHNIILEKEMVGIQCKTI